MVKQKKIVVLPPPKRSRIMVVSYDPRWPGMFEEESMKIRQALGENGVRVHHVGSTAVPGLAAKPKIDIIGVVARGCYAIDALQNIGYSYCGEWNIPFKYGFTKRGEVDVNLHVFETGHPEIELNLLFRDYLRNNAQARDAYAQLKYDLLKSSDSFEKKDSMFAGYTLKKGEFIKDILEKAGFKQFRFLKVSDAAEREAAERFTQQYYAQQEPRHDAFQLQGKPGDMHEIDEARKVDSAHAADDMYIGMFNDPNHAHFIFYQGVDIVGYAHFELFPGHERAVQRVFIVEDGVKRREWEAQFEQLCGSWLLHQRLGKMS